MACQIIKQSVRCVCGFFPRASVSRGATQASIGGSYIDRNMMKPVQRDVALPATGGETSSRPFDAGGQSQLAQLASSDPTIYLEPYRNYLFQYAHLRLRDPHLAEDVVQETFLAAIEALGRYSNRSTVKTWLVAILKRKIVDCIRKHSKEHSVGNDAEWALSEWALSASSRRTGTEPFNGGDPKAIVEKADFWRIIEQCITHLPHQLSKAITLREIDGASTEEICKVLDTSPTNLWVILHRARNRLRRCLNRMWFGR